MGAALVLLLVGLGAMAAGVLIGRYYVPDDRHLRRTARHGKAYMRALAHLIGRDHETAIVELRGVVEENIDDVEPYFALGALFRSRGEHERAIRVHQSLALRERERRKLRQRAMYELGLDFRAAGMPRRATRAMEEVIVEDPDHEGALRVLAALYEEQARFAEAAVRWQKIGKLRREDTGLREHHLLVAAAQAALGRDDLDSAKQFLKGAQKHAETPHFYAAAAELAAAKGNHKAARERLKQALVAEPALVPHLRPGRIAAEEAAAAADKAGRRNEPEPADDLDEGPEAEAAAAELAGGGAQKLLAPAGEAAATAADAVADTTAASGDPAASGGATALATKSTSSLVASAADGAGAGAATTDGAGTGDATADGAGTAAASAASAVGTGATALAAKPAASSGLVASAAALAARVKRAATPPEGAPLLAAKPALTVAERVLAVLAEVEAETGPRLELALIRAQLVPPADTAATAELAKELVARFPDALAARVATARLALAGGDPAAVRTALEVFAADDGALAWTLRGRWQCNHCGHRPGPFTWRCGQCRRWNTLRMETGIEPPPVPSRERRSAPRPVRAEGLLGAAPDHALPTATLDPGLTDDELARAGERRSLLGRVGGWVSGVWRRDRR